MLQTLRFLFLLTLSSLLVLATVGCDENSDDDDSAVGDDDDSSGDDDDSSDDDDSGRTSDG